MYKRQPIETIEGIAEERGTLLKEAGVFCVEDLLAANESLLWRDLKKNEGFPIASLATYVGAARLMQVDGLDGQMAEALTRAGRGSLQRLAAPAPGQIVEDIAAAKEAGIIPSTIDLDTAINWQKDALRVGLMATVHGEVRDEKGPVEGATVHVGHEKALTDSQGRFWLPRLPEGSHTAVVTAAGHLRRELPVRTAVSRLTRATVTLEAGEQEAASLDESKGQPIRTFSSDDRIAMVDTELSALEEGAPLRVVRRMSNGTVRLVGLHRKRVGNRVEVSRLTVHANSVPDRFEKGDVLVRKGDVLAMSEKTAAEHRAAVNPSRSLYRGVRGEIERRRARDSVLHVKRPAPLPLTALSEGAVFRVGRLGQDRATVLMLRGVAQGEIAGRPLELALKQGSARIAARAVYRWKDGELQRLTPPTTHN